MPFKYESVIFWTWFREGFAGNLIIIRDLSFLHPSRRGKCSRLLKI